MSSTRRLDVLANEWVIFATSRQNRMYKPPVDLCPLCPLSVTEPQFTEIPTPAFQVAVFENRFPSLSTIETYEQHQLPEPYQVSPAYGHCEVIVYSENHELTFSDLTLERIQLVIHAWIDRTLDLESDSRVSYVMPFENKGELVGTTLSHPHGQIYAYPDIPPVVAVRLTAAKEFLASTGNCLQCTILTAENVEKQRMVATNSTWIAFVPFAPRFPFEVHVVPLRHVPSLTDLSELEIRELSQLLSKVTKGYDNLWGFSLPYVMAIHQRPSNDFDWREPCHLRIEFKPFHRSADKVKFLAGSELAAGAFVVDVLPEEAAAQLLEAMR